METIQLSKETKEKIATFRLKGESYDDAVNRIYNLAVKKQLRHFLMSSKGFITIEEAKKELNKRYPKKAKSQ